MTNYNESKTITTELMELKRRISRLETSVRAGDPETGSSLSQTYTGGRGIVVGQDSSIRIDEGGSIAVSSDSGAFTLYSGPASDGAIGPKPAGGAQTVTRLGRDSGGEVLEISDTVAGSVYRQTVKMYDADGRTLLEEAPSGGLVTPYVAYGSYPTNSASWPSTTSTTFVSVYSSYAVKQHPLIRVNIGLGQDSGTVLAGQIQILDKNSVITTKVSSLTTTDNATSITFDTNEITLGDEFRVQLQIRVVSGSGAARGIIKGCWGLG